MHYYSFNIKDYRKDTQHLKPMEHYIYRMLIDLYYMDEKPIPKRTQWVMRRLMLDNPEHENMLKNVLDDFFYECDEGFKHKRIDCEITKYHGNAQKNRENGKKGGRPRKNNPEITQSVTDGLPLESQNNPNQEPITINQEPLTTNTESEENASESDYLVNFWNENRPSNAQVKLSVWSKKVKTRLKTFTADEIKQAMLFVINDSWYQSNSQVLIKNVIDSDDRCAAVLEKSSQPAKTNQVENHGNQQPKQSRYDNHKQSLQQQLQKQFEAEDAQQGVDSFDCRDVYEMDN